MTIASFLPEPNSMGQEIPVYSHTINALCNWSNASFETVASLIQEGLTVEKVQALTQTITDWQAISLRSESY